MTISSPYDSSRHDSARRSTPSLYETMLDAIADAVLIIGTDGMVQRANRPARRAFRRTAPQLIGAEAEALPGFPQLDVVADQKVTLEDGHAGRMVIFRPADPATAVAPGEDLPSNHRTAEARVATAGGASAAAPAAGAVSSKLSREVLYQILQQFLDGDSELVTRHRPDASMSYASPGSLALLGREPAELIEAWSRIGNAEDGLGHLRLYLRRCALSRTEDTFTWRVTLPSGEDRWMESRALVAYDDDTGEPIELVAVTRDVTGPWQVESALAASEDRFRLAFEASPIGMSIIAADGSVLQANEAASVMTGHSVEALSHMHCVDLCCPEDWPIIEAAFNAIFDEGETRVSFEKRYVRADGEIRWDQVHATVIEWRDERPWRLLVQSLDITERREVDTKLHYLADHDPLTGLLNRRSFERALREHQHRVANDGPRGALLVLDLDHFKYVNDSLGHHAGDQLIRGVAHVLIGTLTDKATVARLGGDEFAVLLPTGGAMEARVVAETLIDAVRETTVQLRGGSRRKVTTSVGVALFDGVTHSADDMLVSADLAMYDAKEEGRNRWALASRGDVSDRRRTRSRVSWVERIERALEGDDFELYAQPIVDLRTGTVDQYELLLRMRESDGSLTLPADFLAVAERLDLIQGIDRWVTTRAIDLLADHQRSGRGLSLEINLSGRSLNDVGLLDLISNRITTSGVDPHGLIFEVTETAAVSDIAAARNLAHSLADLGCRFALDDFGAGFGSFYYLKYLPFDFLKIDGEFVSHCTSNETDKTIIRALVNVARQLGKRTVAEFTRDAATLKFLRTEGVDHAQGYHVGRPLPLADALGPAVLPFIDLSEPFPGDAPPSGRARRDRSRSVRR